MSFPGDEHGAEHTRPLGWSTPPSSGGPAAPGGWGGSGQPGWGAPPPPGWGSPAGWAPPVRDHPQAVTALVLGVIALAGGVACLVPILVSPFAWAVGSRSLREIRASGGQLGGEGQARAGQVMGMVGTALLVLGLVVLVLVVVLAIANGGDSGTGYSNA